MSYYSPQDDQWLVNELSRMYRWTNDIQQLLFKPRPGCSCDSTGVCAFHANTFNRLNDVKKTVDAAIKEIVEYKP